MLLISIRLYTHLIINRHVTPTTRLRALTAINKTIRVIWQRMTLTKSHRARYTITRRLCPSRLTAKATRILRFCLLDSVYRLYRYRLAYRGGRINVLDRRTRHLSVKSIRLYKRIRERTCTITMNRRNGINNSSNASTHHIDHVRSNTRRQRIVIMSSDISNRVKTCIILPALLNGNARINSDRLVHQIQPRVRLLRARMCNIYIDICHHYRALMQPRQDRRLVIARRRVLHRRTYVSCGFL